MRDSSTRVLALVFLLAYLTMQLLCILPNDNKRQLVFIIWLVLAYMSYTPIIKKVLKMRGTGYLYSFTIFVGIIMLLGHSVVYAISSMVVMMELFSPLLMFRILRTETKTVQRFVFLVVSVIFTVNLVVFTTYINNSVTDYGLRDIEHFMEYKNSFYYLYAIAILVPFIIYYLSHQEKAVKHKLLKSVVGYSVCLVLAYFVIKAQFMTAIVFMVMGGVFALSYKRSKLTLTVPIAVIIVFTLFQQFSGELLRIADENNATAVSSRIEELQHILSNDTENAEDYSKRQDLSQSSLETFLNNPIIGVLYKYEDINEGLQHGIGNHAEWLDSLAKYGLFGFLLLLFIVKAMIAQSKVVESNIHYLLFGLLGFFNPTLGFLLTCAVFFYMPMLAKVCFRSIKST